MIGYNMLALLFALWPVIALIIGQDRGENPCDYLQEVCKIL